VVDASSPTGRATEKAEVAFGVGVRDLTTDSVHTRRAEDEEGVAVPLTARKEGIGALLVFAPHVTIDRAMNRALASLADQASPRIARAMARETTGLSDMVDHVTKRLDQSGLEQAMRAHSLKEGTSGHGSLVRVDIEHFDQLDHAIADEVLELVARVLQSAVRASDLSARIEMGEFAIFLPDTSNRLAQRVANRVCSQANRAAFNLANRLLTFAYGVASVPETVAHVADLLPAASLALTQIPRTVQPPFRQS
jgi:diguanylate cyclase (GGDEF)-like protein